MKATSVKVFKFFSGFFLTLILIVVLDKSWVINGNRLPPLGKFLDPFHGFWHNIKGKNDRGPALEKIPGLIQKVTVIYDSILIPHIFAGNDEDLYFAQGYVTATHRLWQMEFQTHAAAGRVSEIIGTGKDGFVLNYDRTQRRLGMVYGAEHTLEEVMTNPLTKMMVERYTQGINQYINSLHYHDLPFEYKLLDYKPEAWTPLKCALLLKNMAQTLCIGDKDMEMTNALKLFGKDMVDLLYPDRDPVGDPIVDNPGTWNFNAVTLHGIPPALPKDLINLKKDSPSDPNLGSNNWAVSGSKTKTGSPLLCGDPHLLLTLPSIWYAIQLNAPGINVMGASLPGAPAVIIGFNDSIAWSVTNAQRDLVDWFSIQYQNKTREKYLLDNTWVETRKVVETFSVRGESALYDTVIYTNWGPVTYDQNFHAEKNQKDYAFRWIAHDTSNEFTAFYNLNRARNHAEYMKALDHFSAPAQNFVFASTTGDIAMRAQGKYPVRRKDEGKFVLDGSQRSNGWQAFIPNEQNVMHKNPARGFVSSANQYPVDSTYPYYINATHYEAYRNRRINQVLEKNNSITVKDLMNLQNDNFNLKAMESLPLFLHYLDTTKFTEAEAHAHKILRSWNYYNTIDAEGASYYEAWWDNLMPLIWDELQRKNLALTNPTTFRTLELIKERPDLIFFDVRRTPQKENAGDVIRQAFSLSVRGILDWKTSHGTQTVPWADYKDSYITSLLRIEPLNIHIRHGGNHDIVNANSRTNGPSWRMIVSLEKSGVKAWATYPGGQSENPGSEHYADMLERWIRGEYFQLLFIHVPEEAKSKMIYSTQLDPER